MLAKLLKVRIFDLEASGACNLHCAFCPRDQLPPTGMMSLETFCNFLNGVRLGSTDTLSFVGLGEPLLNRSLPEFIRAAKERYPKVRTWVTTNGTLLNEKTLSPLLDAGLDTLDISFNGLDPETYERQMKGAKFERSLANVEYAVQEIQRRAAGTQLQINYVVSKENCDRESSIQSFWRERGVKFFRPQRLHDRGGLIGMAGMTPPDQPGLRGRSCAVFEVVTFVTWQGDVMYCCHDIPRKHKLGSVNKDSWDEIWARKQEVIRRGEWPAMCRICKDPLRHDMRERIDEMIWQEVGSQVVAGFRRAGSLLGRLVRAARG